MFLALAGPLGIFVADIVAFAVCTLANTAANRRLTFSLSGRSGRARHHARGLLVGALPLSVNLLVLTVAVATGLPSVFVALVLLTAINTVATFVKFALLNRWVFDSPRAAR